MRRNLTFMLFAAASMLPGGTVETGTRRAELHAGVAEHGKLLYIRYCVGCHGKDGDGMGENAPYLDPRPRDFTAGVFKCRSTPTGSLPLDSDLIATVGRGLYA